jgi:adenine-specific DNA glycosylase
MNAGAMLCPEQYPACLFCIVETNVHLGDSPCSLSRVPRKTPDMILDARHPRSTSCYCSFTLGKGVSPTWGS